MNANIDLKLKTDSVESSISPTAMRALTSFAGFASETYLGNINRPLPPHLNNCRIDYLFISLCILVNAHIINIINLVLPFMVYGNIWI